MRPPVPVFVIDGHDIELYPDAASAAIEIEGYDASQVDVIGADGPCTRLSSTVRSGVRSACAIRDEAVFRTS